MRWLRATGNIKQITLCVAIVLASVSLLHSADTEKTFYYSSIAAGRSGGIVFRTVFRFMNESTGTAFGELSLFSEKGTPLDAETSAKWVGERGILEARPGQRSFTIVPKSSLELIVVPGASPLAGWAKLRMTGDCEKQVYLQVAKTPLASPVISTGFEHYLENEAEIFPTEGLKAFSFPIFLFQGMKNLNTAFSIVNLSSAPAAVRLTLRPNVARTVQLQPGQLLADYFDHFWPIGFIDIFPLIFYSAAEVQSDAPLAVTVLRTNQGLPLSGVMAAAMPGSAALVEASLGTEFTLAINRTALVRSENLRVTFWNVTEDSRCPIDVVCIQAGRATVALRLSKDAQNLGEFLVSTDQNSNQTVVDGYAVRLLRVEPPRVSTQSITISDYRITLLLTRN